MDLAHLKLAVRSVVVSTRSALHQTSGVEAVVARNRALGLLDELASSASSPAAQTAIAEGREELDLMGQEPSRTH